MRYLSLGQQKLLVALALFVFAVLYLKFCFRRSSPPEEVYKEVVIEVLGEVQKPGIYIFKDPPALKEAIVKAGGLKENAFLGQLSSSEILKTGTQLRVSKESSTEIKIKLAKMDANKLLAFSIPLDLNRVSVEDLCLIPGIGESLAREIVSYRKRKGEFRSAEELKDVKGIEEKKYQSLKTFFTVE